MDKEYKLSAKRADTGKWWTFGGIKTNQWGNLQASIRVTEELKTLINANDGKWINFSLFEDEQKREVPQEAKQEIQRLNKPLDDEIPF